MAGVWDDTVVYGVLADVQLYKQNTYIYQKNGFLLAVQGSEIYALKG